MVAKEPQVTAAMQEAFAQAGEGTTIQVTDKKSGTEKLFVVLEGVWVEVIRPRIVFG